MLALSSIKRIISSTIKRNGLARCPCVVESQSRVSLFETVSVSLARGYITSVEARSYGAVVMLSGYDRVFYGNWVCRRFVSGCSIELKMDSDVVRFSFGKQSDRNECSDEGKKRTKRVKMSRKAKLNELRFYRLKAKKKMKSPNPEVRIRYKLEKAKRKEAWLIEKLRKFEVPKIKSETYDPEMLTEEEKHYLKRRGEKKKNFILVGRRGVFGGVVLNKHLHWKKHETVKVICRPCKPGKIQEYAEELARLSKGIVIDIRPNNSIIFYRGKNYEQPTIMSPPDTLSKQKALEKFKYEQSLEHTSQFIEKLEKELEEYLEHVARYKKRKEVTPNITPAET